MTSCQQNVLFARAKQPGLFSPALGLTQRVPPLVLVRSRGGQAVRLTSPYGCDPFLAGAASGDCRAQATPGQLGVHVTGSHA